MTMNIAASRIFFLILVWWICSAIAEPFFIICGAVCVWLTYKIAGQLKLLHPQSLFQHPLRLFVYGLWLLKEIALAALNVSRILWQVKPRIMPRLFTTEMQIKNDLARTLYGNSITLTPGTACIDMADTKIQIHALEKAGMVDIKSGRMENAVSKIFNANTRSEAGL